MLEKARFSRYTQILRKAFPRWSKIRKDPEAVGSQFLAVTGLQLDDVEFYLNYALRQYHLRTADIFQVDVIYKAHIPTNLKPDMSMRFNGGSHILVKTDSVEAFLHKAKEARENATITYWNPCYIDFDAKYVYVLKPYEQENSDFHYKYGHVMMSIFDPISREITIQDNLPLMIHHVWNFFDEFGLLLGLSRLEGESNEGYKNRLVDVFKRPANSTKHGLLNAIIRELGLTKEATWSDGGSTLVLRDSRIDLDSIHVSDQPFPLDLIGYDNSGRVILQGQPMYIGVERKVTYNAAITFHELHDEQDTELRKELFRVDGTATPLLQYYVDTIGDRIPTLWGQWRWDESFWDIANEEISGYGKIPSFMDANISSWKAYGKEG